VTDLLPPEVSKWQFVEEKARAVLEAFGYREARARFEQPYVEGRRWEREAATKWYRFEDGGLAATFFGAGEASADAEVVGMAAAIATEAGAPAERLRLEVAGLAAEWCDGLGVAVEVKAGERMSFRLRGSGHLIASGHRYQLSLPDRRVAARLMKVELGALVAAVPDPPASFEPQLATFFACEGDTARAWALRAAHQLRLAGIRAEVAHDGAPLAAQLERARGLGVRLAVVVDAAGLAAGRVRIEDFGTGRGHDVAPAEVEAAVRPLLD
jgi:histidyl-tRNA synthetase